MAIAKVNIAAIGDPWSVDIKYPTIPKFPSFPKNKAEIQARNKGTAAYRQTYSWLGDGLLTQPRLILGYEMNYGYLERAEDYQPTPKFARKWRRIAHQHSGILCGHTYMFARMLTPTPVFLESMKTIVGMNNKLSVFGPTLSEAIRYENSLRTASPTVKISAQETYHQLNEAIFPLDFSFGLLKQICTDKLPAEKNWSNQFEKDGSMNDIFKSPHYMKLYIFSQNSD